MCVNRSKHLRTSKIQLKITEVTNKQKKKRQKKKEKKTPKEGNNKYEKIINLSKNIHTLYIKHTLYSQSKFLHIQPSQEIMENASEARSDF